MTVTTPDQKRVVVVGATGMVGGYVLIDALASREVSHVTSIGRRRLDVSHPKLTQVLHADFSDCTALEEALRGQDAAIFCLGTYTGAVSDADLRKVTVDYIVEFVRVLHSASPHASFAFLSGSGADPTGKSRLAFARYKGEAESAIGRAGFLAAYMFRPAYIYPVKPRREPNFGYRALRAIYPVFRVLFPNLVIPADDLAWAMVDIILRGKDEHSPIVFENKDIRAIAKARRNAAG